MPRSVCLVDTQSDQEALGGGGARSAGGRPKKRSIGGSVPNHCIE